MSKCDLCDKPFYAHMVFEAGNGGETIISVSLCKPHTNEAEKTGEDFDLKYADQLNQLAAEKNAGMDDPREER
jgi:hypothetical protein